MFLVIPISCFVGQTTAGSVPIPARLLVGVTHLVPLQYRFRYVRLRDPRQVHVLLPPRYARLHHPELLLHPQVWKGAICICGWATSGAAGRPTAGTPAAAGIPAAGIAGAAIGKTPAAGGGSGARPSYLSTL